MPLTKEQLAALASKGGGLYSNECASVQALTGGSAVLIVIGGKRGNGFAVAAVPEVLEILPMLLRDVALDIEAQLATRQ